MRLILFFIVIGVSVYSQDCEETLQGTITDFHDGTPLVGATVVVAGEERFAQTDLDGTFRLEGLCPGSYTLQVSHPECDTEAIPVTLPMEKDLRIRLEHHLEALDQITVKGSAAITKVQSQQEKKADKQAIENLSYASLGDILKQISGVSSLNTGSTVVKPVIQGLHSSRVVLMNNGVRMQDQEWGAEHAPNIDANSAESVSVIKGASALQYSGDAVGGIILVEPKRFIRKDSLYGSTLLAGATNGRGGSITSALTKTYENGWYAQAQGTLKRFGDTEAPDYVLSNTGVSEKAATLRFGLNKFTHGFEGFYSYYQSSLGILSASHLGGAEDQVRALNSPEPLVIDDFSYTIDNPRQEVSHHLAKARFFKRITNFGKLEAQYDFQQNNRLEFDIRRGGREDRAAVDLDLTTHTFALDASYDAHSKLKANAGVLFRYQNNFANPETGVRRLIPDYDKTDLAVYALGKYTTTTNWTLEAGLRYDYTFLDAQKFYRTSFWEDRGYDVQFADLVVEDYGNQVLVNPELTFHNMSATVGAGYGFGKNYTLLANYSLASRAPNPSELFSEGLHHSASRIELGDLRFRKEVAHKVSVALEKETERFSFSLNPYINRIRDFITLEPRGVEQTIRGNFQVWEFRQTEAVLYGIDLDATIVLNPYFSLGNRFSMVKGEDLSTNTALIQMPPANLFTALTYSNEKLNNLKLSLESNYVFRQNEFPDTNFEVYLPSTDSTALVDVSTPPEAYHLLHFHADADFALSDKTTFHLGLSIKNIANTNYRDYLNRMRYYADDLGRNIVLRLKINY